MSQRLLNAQTPTNICTDANASLTLPPGSFAPVPSWWIGENSGAVPEVDVGLWADGARALTAVELFGAEQHPFTFPDITVTGVAAVKASLDLSTKTTHCDSVIEAKAAGEGGDLVTIAFAAGSLVNAGVLDESAYPAIVYNYKSGTTTVTNFEAAIAASTNLDVKTPGTGANILANPADTFTATALAGGDDSELHAVAHGLLTGDGPVRVTSTLTIPTLLAAATDYYVTTDDADNIGLAATLADALAGNVIEFTSAGSGVIRVVASGLTERVHWHSHGLLGKAADGVVTLDAQLAEWQTRPHRGRVVAYALKATFGAGAGKVTAAIWPTVDVR